MFSPLLDRNLTPSNVETHIDKNVLTSVSLSHGNSDASLITHVLGIILCEPTDDI